MADEQGSFQRIHQHEPPDAIALTRADDGQPIDVDEWRVTFGISVPVLAQKQL